jgi:predicted TIM-barrel fold metal-dependent hydrolase
MSLKFFDCNARYGAHFAADEFRPAPDAAALAEQMARAGVSKAVVWRLEQWAGSAITANNLLADDIKDIPNLYGTWAVVPSHTHEIPDPDEMPAAMKKHRIVGWRLFPDKARFLPRGLAIGDWMELAVARRIPVFINTAHGTTLENVADLMEEFPELTLVLAHATDWPSDRFLRPLVAAFPNLHLDMTFMITDGGIESFVAEYGAGRLLYGSGFPDSYFGASMLMIKHAQISEEDRAAIAGGNLERIIAEVSL